MIYDGCTMGQPEKEFRSVDVSQEASNRVGSYVDYLVVQDYLKRGGQDRAVVRAMFVEAYKLGLREGRIEATKKSIEVLKKEFGV